MVIQVQQPTAAGTVCLFDNNTERHAQIHAAAAKLGLRFETHSRLDRCVVKEGIQRPACLLVADDLLPAGYSLAGQHVATIVLANRPTIASVVQYMRAGAITVLVEPLESECLANWIDEALANDRQRFEIHCRLQQLSKTYSQFTPRKQTVLQHMIDGRASKWSAHSLDVSRRTIELDRAEILSAFGVGNAIELARQVGPWLEAFPMLTRHKDASACPTGCD